MDLCENEESQIIHYSVLPLFTIERLSLREANSQKNKCGFEKLCDEQTHEIKYN